MKHLLSTLALLLATTTGAQATIVNHADVNGIRTFQDTSTGYIWADLDNFAAANQGQGLAAAITDPSYSGYLNALQAAGFTFASTALVDAMKASVPIGSWAEIGQFRAAVSTDWGDIIEVVRGYSDEGNGVWRLHRIDAPNTWAGSPLGANPTNIFSSTGLWAYRTSAPGASEVPEPGTLALLGVAALFACAQKRRPRA